MTDTCRVTADTNEYYDRMAKTPDAIEPTDAHVKKKLANLVDEVIVDRTHPLIATSIADCESFDVLTTIQPVESVDRDMNAMQALYLARCANQFLKDLAEILGDNLYVKALQEARDDVN